MPGPAARSRSRVQSRALLWASRRARLLAPLMTLIVMVIFFSLVTDTFLQISNFQNVATQIAPVAVAAAGITFVLLCAEIDLSIAAVATFTGLVTAAIWVNNPFAISDVVLLTIVSIVFAILLATIMGIINGVFVAYIGIPSFMMTLAMLTIASGLAIWVGQGKPIFGVPDFIRTLGGVGTQVLGIPVIGIFALAVLLICEVILSYTKFGRYVFMTGANREAAEMSGVNTRRVIMLSLTICAVTAGLAGMLYIGRLGSANPAAGDNLLIDAIAAVVLGGTSLFGGEGGIKNTLLGLLIFGVLSNGLNLIPGLDFNFKLALQGIILVAALLLNVMALRLERVQTQTE
ncbi:MAG: ABC transporter permease [Chloroflexia bacterium]|nr:ABC transporter permease [Chloroflexia bacterium]